MSSKIPRFMIEAVDAMDPDSRREFILHTNKNTPKSKIQIELAKHGLTVRDVRRWLNQAYGKHVG